MTSQPPPEAGVPTCYRHTDRETYIRCQRCERAICPDCMRDASVGFQCPTCVAEGTKSTRSGRTPYGGKRSANPGLTSMVLMVMNAVVWIFLTVTTARSEWYGRLALLPQGRCVPSNQPDQYYPNIGEAACAVAGGRMWVPGVSDGAYWQLVTSAFTHLEIWHIGFNMLALWFLGPQMELSVGRIRFLALYLLSALSGSAAVYWLSDPGGSTIGASGAVFGLMGALLVLAFKVGGNVQQILVWLGINAVITFTFPNISWQGHLGGFLGGVLIAAILVYSPRRRRGTWQALGLSALTLGLIAAIVARTATL